MNVIETFDGFDFNQHFKLYNQVGKIRPDDNSVITNVDRLLLIDM